MHRVTICIFYACNLYPLVGTGPLPKVFTRMCLDFNRLALLLAPARLAQTFSVPLPFSHLKPLSLYYPRTARTGSENALYAMGVWWALGELPVDDGRPAMDGPVILGRCIPDTDIRALGNCSTDYMMSIKPLSQHSDQSGRSMSATKPNFDTLRLIAEMPFLDRLEWSAVSGRPQQRVYEDVAPLGRAGLVATVPHSTPLMSPTRRLYVTLRGLRRLANQH